MWKIWWRTSERVRRLERVWCKGSSMLCESNTMEGVQGTCAFWRSRLVLFASFLTGFVEEFLALHQLISNLVCSAVLQLKEESNFFIRNRA